MLGPGVGRWPLWEQRSCTAFKAPDTQALIVVCPLHISQTKLTECTWPFTHSLFSLTLLHSSSYPLLSSSACGLALTTCLLYCRIVPYLDGHIIESGFLYLNQFKCVSQPRIQNYSCYYLGLWDSYPGHLDTPHLHHEYNPLSPTPGVSLLLTQATTGLILLERRGRGAKNKSRKERFVRLDKIHINHM